MKRIFAVTGIVIAMMGMHVPAHASKAHVHGNALMQVVLDGKNIEIALQSPLDSLVGFEHAPRNERQRKAIQSMEQQFRTPASLFVPTETARCTAQPAELMLPFRGNSSSQPKHEHGHGHAEQTHAELEATVRFECENPAALKGIEVKLFEVFPKLHRIDAQMVSGSGQKAARLTPKQRNLQW